MPVRVLPLSIVRPPRSNVTQRRPQRRCSQSNPLIPELAGSEVEIAEVEVRSLKGNEDRIARKLSIQERCRSTQRGALREVAEEFVDTCKSRTALVAMNASQLSKVFLKPRYLRICGCFESETCVYLWLLVNLS